jgi:hypothetical protein
MRVKQAEISTPLCITPRMVWRMKTSFAPGCQVCAGSFGEVASESSLWLVEFVFLCLYESIYSESRIKTTRSILTFFIGKMRDPTCFASIVVLRRATSCHIDILKSNNAVNHTLQMRSRDENLYFLFENLCRQPIREA